MIIRKIWDEDFMVFCDCGEEMMFFKYIHDEYDGEIDDVIEVNYLTNRYIKKGKATTFYFKTQDDHRFLSLDFERMLHFLKQDDKNISQKKIAFEEKAFMWHDKKLPQSILSVERTPEDYIAFCLFTNKKKFDLNQFDKNRFKRNAQPLWEVLICSDNVPQLIKEAEEFYARCQKYTKLRK